MKSKIYLFFLLTFFVSCGFAQKKEVVFGDTSFFNYAYWNGVADKKQLNAAERAELISGQKAIFIEQQTHSHVEDKDLVWVDQPIIAKKGKSYNGATVSAGPCSNIDFETGTFSGWTRSTGYNPLTNVMGCCPNANGDQTIMSGTGNDPYGGFPVVYPGGGSFSLRLGSVATGGKADRMSQTFFVTSANANFTYRYAVVLNDGGHTLAEQPRFTSEIIDTLGNPINCTFYQVSAGSGVTGYSLSSSGAPGNNSPVIYKGWTDVAVDLTPNIGQNVTIRFTVYDCGPSGHFAYAYLDGLCTKFDTSVSDTTCPNVPVAMCAPGGFSVNVWNGPGFSNDSSQCILPTIPGTYSCSTLIRSGCPGPTFIHTLTTLPAPILSFTPVTTGICATTYTFNDTQSISPGSIVSFGWDFGDGSTGGGHNPSHTYATSGTYPVKLRATSSRGCVDSVVNYITIFPTPNLVYSPPSNCLNTLVQFTNSSSIALGSITGYTWNLGNGNTSNLVNPTDTYTATGTYTVNLSAVSNLGCTASLTQTLGIFPPPIISFTANPLCDINGTAFTPSTSASVNSGSLAVFNWNFGDGGTSTQANPVHIYTAPGAYTVTFSAITNHNCSATTSSSFIISPTPTMAFATTSLNNCSPNFTFTNQSAIASGPLTFTWTLAGNNMTQTTTATSPTYTFPAIGNYTVSLVGTSNMGCTDTVSQLISVYPLPIININVPASCESAIFTVSTTAVSGSVTSYLWDFGDPASGLANNTSTLQNPTHNYLGTNNYTISLNIVSNLNCPSSITKTLSVYPNPVANFTYVTANNCSPSFSFTNLSTLTSTIGASVLSSYLWNIGGTVTTLQDPQNMNFPGNGTYSVSMIAITNHNCSDTAYATIQVHPVPKANFTVNPVCEATPISIISTASISPIPVATGSITSYLWSFGDGAITTSSTSPTAHSYTAPGVYNVNYSLTSNMGCSSSVSHTVEIFPSANANFSITSPACSNGATQFSSTPTVVNTSTIYANNWDFGDGSIGSNPVTTHTYAAPGNYVVTYSVITNNECQTLVTKTITIYPLPTVSFTTNGGCLNTPSQFASTASITLGSVLSYTYDFGDGSSAAAQNINHTYTLAGAYSPTVTVTSDHSCTASAVNNLTINPLPVLNFSPNGACLGTPVLFSSVTSSIITGSINSFTWNFGNGNTSNSASPTYTYPASGSYSVGLNATSNLGCVGTLVKNISIYPLPQVTVTPLHNSCVNDSIQINGNISIDGSNIPSTVQVYTLNFGDGGFKTSTVVPSSYSIYHKYTAYNTYTLNLKAMSNFGCVKDTSATIIVYPKPFVSWTASQFCHDDSTKFLNSSTIPTGYTIDQHLWNFNDNSATPSSTLSNPSHLFLGPGNTFTVYAISLTESSHPEGLTSPVTCSLIVAKTITIYPTPVPSFNTNSVCLGNPTQFSNTTPTANISGWSWYQYNNGVLSGLAQNPSFTYSAAGVYTAALLALNSFGCKDTAYNTVTIYQNPVASFTNNNNCLSQQSIFFNNTTYTDGGPGTYLWTTGTNTIGTNTDATFLFPTAGVYTVALNAVSNLGCVSNYTSTITVYPLPLINFSTSQTCIGQNTQFNNFTSGNIASYTWNFGDPISGANNTSGAINPSHLYANAGPYNSTLTAVTDKNCSASFTANVIVHNKPMANFTNTTICATEKLSFTDLSTTQDGAITKYEWDFNGDNIVDQTTLTPSYAYSVAGNYQIRLTVTSEFGCVDDTLRQVTANPKATAAISSDNRSGCPTLCVNFKDGSIIANGSFTTNWDFGDGDPSTTFKNPSHCFSTTGNYNVNLTLVSDMGCVTKQTYPGYVSVYPVPTAGFKVEPEQIDEDEPIITISNQASSDASSIKYYVSDGSSFGTANFTHYIKNLKQTKPMVVQIAKNQYGCVDTIMQVLDIKPAYVIYFPNVFTPNGDGTNDDFRPKGVGITKFTIQIYDRWGHQVFKSNDITDTWDGKSKNDDAIKEDVYTWKAQVTDIFNKNHFLVGHVTVIR